MLNSHVLRAAYSSLIYCFSCLTARDVLSGLVRRGRRVQPFNLHCDRELGSDFGVVLSQDLGLYSARSDIRGWTQTTIASHTGFGDNGVGLHLFWLGVSLGAAELGAIPLSRSRFDY
jgi:hypothetical protein